MSKKINKGFSMVEIIIALAVFAILMMPIVTSLSSSIKNITKGKTLQYRNDYAKNLIEYVKEDSLENVIKGNYFSKVGAHDLKLPNLSNPKEDMTTGYFKGNVTNASDPSKTAEYERYMLQGNVELGTKHKTHTFAIEISNQDYAKKEIEIAGFKNPNNMKMGVVEDLDHNKVALINGTIANYDSAVANAYLARKLTILKEKAPTKYEQYISSENKVDIFSADTASRKITVKVEGKQETDKDKKGYKVSCIMSYHDNSEVALDGEERMSKYLKKSEDIEYIPYTAEFHDLPDIYLMYNPCVYNGSYSLEDYITIDTSGMKDSIDKRAVVNLFVVETAEKYSKTIQDTLIADNKPEEELNKKVNKSLIFDTDKITHGTKDRNEVAIYIAATKNSDLVTDDGGKEKSLINVYHNFGTVPDYEVTKPDGSKEMVKSPNQKNDKFYYNTLPGYLTTDYQLLKSKYIKDLNQASQEQRGLYNIKIWIQEGDSVDTSKEPILSGTKGGNDK